MSAAQQATYPCNIADDQSWSRVILTSQREQHYRAASTGNVLVNSLTNYGYSLTYPLNAQQCSDCVAGFYWGNQNDGDYLDYYNTKFMGFAQATVFNPDGSKEVHKYFSTDGFGVYDTTQVGCFAQYPPCRQAPWWSLNNAGHGQETQVDSYATDGATVLRRATTQYALACPPSGVSASPSFPAYPTAPGWGNWNGNRVSGLGHNNPVAVCAVRPKSSDTYTLDGASDQFAAPHSSTSFAYDSLGRMTDQTSGVDTGLKAEYYDNSDLTGLKFTRLDATVDNNWGTGTPFPSMGVDTFSVRWTGYVQPQYSGTYTFYTNSDDGVRLWVNGTQLVNNWTNHGPTENSGTIALTAGQRYTIKLEYYENTSGAVIQLSWSHASQPKQIIPATALFTRAEGGGGTALGSVPATVTHTNYIQNDAITATLTGATGRYLIDFPSYVYTRDGGNTVHYTCTRTRYDGAAYAEGQQSSLTKGEATTTETFTGCGNSGNSFALTGTITTSTVYDVYGQPVATKDGDANAGIGGHVGCTVGGVQYTTCATYDSTYKTLEVSSGNALNQTTTTGYTASAAGGFGFWPTSNTDFNAQTSSYAYDALGRMTSTTLPGETGGATKSWVYTVWCNTTGPQAPCVELDEIDRIDATTTVTSRAFYDGFGRLVETRSPGPSGQDVVAYAWYDESGDLYFESNSYLVTAYTGAPGVAAFSAPDKNQVGMTKERDALDRVTRVTDPLSQQTTTSYATVCNAFSGDAACYEQTTIIDPLSHKRTSANDALGRLAYSQRYTGNSSGSYAVYATGKYQYDASGNLVKITHPDGTTTTTFAFDAVGQKISQTDPDTGTTTYAYDKNGSLTQTTDARGASGTVYAGYDGLDRLLWRNTTNSPTGARVSYTYDSTTGGNIGIGRLTSTTFSGPSGSGLSGSYAYVYDSRGRATSTTTTVNGTPYTVTKTYDSAGNTLTQTYPTGEVITWGFTGNNWLGQVTRTQGGSTITLADNLSYSGSAGAAGTITGMRIGDNTFAYAASYDAAQRLSAITLTRVSDSATLYRTAPTWDANGNVAQVETTLPTGTDNQAFCYDEQDRLVWAGANGTPPCGQSLTPGTLTAANYTQSFSYDTLGRLTSGPTGSYSYGDAAHKHAATAIGSAWTASYNAAGQMTCRAPSSASTCAGGSPTGQQLTYDNEGWLTGWQDAPTSPTSTAQYLYDGDGNRVALQTTSGGAQTLTTYLGNIEEVATTSGGANPGTTTTTYYYAGPIRVALAVSDTRTPGTTTFSYLADDVLNTDAVAFDTAGLPVASRLYQPYGQTRYSNGVMPGSFGFTGQREDAVSGLDYFIYRYYDPTAGQFISPDSVLADNGADLLDLSRYAYVEGNPSTKTDPTGHCPWCITVAVGALVGAAVGAVSSVASQAASGHCCDWGAVGREAAIGAVTGAVTGLLGPAAGMAARAAVGAAVSAGEQVVRNKMEGKPLGDGVALAAGIGGAFGALGAPGVGRFMGKVAGRAGGALSKVASKALNRGGKVCALSFSPDTAVATPDGEQAIGTLEDGDQVEAYDPETGTASTQTVEHVWINHDDDLIDLTLRSDAGSQTRAVANASTKQQEVAVASHGTRAPPPAPARQPGQPGQRGGAPGFADETVHTTAKHPWLTMNRGWVQASDLQVGEQVIRLDGGTATITAVQVVPGAATMYNLQVSHLHTFAVGTGQYVVHNCNPQAIAADSVAKSLNRMLYRASGLSVNEYKSRVTIAVGAVAQKGGGHRWIAAINEGAGDLIPKFNALVRRTNVLNVGPKVATGGHAHAESFITKYAGRRLLGIGASNYLCARCFFNVVGRYGDQVRGSPGRWLGGVLRPN